MNQQRFWWACTRIGLGLIFLWAFFDKVFGLGYATTADKSWLAGNPPTVGFLKFGTRGPFAEIFQAMAGNPIVDWLFMLGLLGIGIALLFGIAMRLASYGGALMMLLMWLAVLPKVNHPFMDEHVIYFFVLLGLLAADAGKTLGMGAWWSKTSLVKKMSFLK